MQLPNYRRIAERSSDGYFRYVSGEGVTYLSNGFRRLLGQEFDDYAAAPHDLADLIHEDDKDEYGALLNRLLHGQVDQSAAVLKLIRSDQTPVWVELFAILVNDESGEIIGIDGVARDVSEHLQVADLLSRRSLELAALLEAQKTLAGSLDYEVTLQSIVEQSRELLDARLSVVFLPDSESEQMQPMADAGSVSIPTKDLRFMVGEGVSGWVMAHGEKQRVDRLSADARGGRLLDQLEDDVSVLAVPLRIADRIAGTLTVVGAVNQYQDEDLSLLEALAQVASLALVNSREYKVVEHRARIDGLTKAHNRLFLDEHLPTEIDRADRLGYPLAVMMVDVDNLKVINDELGHPTGDEVLQHLVRVLRRNSRETDWVARYGGDEFIVVLPGCPQHHLDRLSEKIQQDLRKSSKPVEYSISIGGAVRQPGAGSADQLLRFADEAERRAKRRGGASISTHSQESSGPTVSTDEGS